MPHAIRECLFVLWTEFTVSVPPSRSGLSVTLCHACCNEGKKSARRNVYYFTKNQTCIEYDFISMSRHLVFTPLDRCDRCYDMTLLIAAGSMLVGLISGQSRDRTWACAQSGKSTSRSLNHTMLRPVRRDRYPRLDRFILYLAMKG